MEISFADSFIRRRLIMDIVLYYIRTRFNVNMLSIFILVGLFMLIRDVPLLKKKKLDKESAIAKVLGYLYILGGTTMYIIARII